MKLMIPSAAILMPHNQRKAAQATSESEIELFPCSYHKQVEESYNRKCQSKLHH